LHMTPPATPFILEDHCPARIRGSVPPDGGRLRHRPSVAADADSTATAQHPGSRLPGTRCHPTGLCRHSPGS
jgi:hypothetical protein